MLLPALTSIIAVLGIIGSVVIGVVALPHDARGLRRLIRGNGERRDFPDFYVVGHRGWPARYPENTVESMIASLEQGVFMSEFDVQITKDEQVIVMHDTSVDRTTPNKGPVSDYTLAQLERMDAGSWKSPLYSSYRVPSLKRMLEAFTTFPDWKSRYLMVDIKYDPERIIGAMAKMNIPRDVLSRLVISPWTEQGANYVRKVFGSVPVVGYINGSVDDDLLQRDNWEGQVLNLKKEPTKKKGREWAIRQRNEFGRQLMAWTARSDRDAIEDSEFAWDNCWNAVVGDWAPMLVVKAEQMRFEGRSRNCK